MTYRPEELQQPPFTFSITSECPALGHKVGNQADLGIGMYSYASPIHQAGVAAAFRCGWRKHSCQVTWHLWQQLQTPAITSNFVAPAPPQLLQGHFTSRTRIESAGPNRCLHILEQTIE